MIVRLENVEKSFGRFKALKGISFILDRSERLALLGPNGSGKTTTVKIISGQIRPTKGSLEIFGRKKVDEWVKRKMGVVSHNTFLYEDLTAYENLKFFASLYDVDDERIRELLHEFGLWKRRHDLVRNYSRGMKQRLSIARALLNNPELLILDEPTTGLDVEGRNRLFELLSGFNSAMIFTTHNLQEAEMICDRTVFIKEGGIVYDGKSENLEEIYRGIME